MYGEKVVCAKFDECASISTHQNTAVYTVVHCGINLRVLNLVLTIVSTYYTQMDRNGLCGYRATFLLAFVLPKHI